MKKLATLLFALIGILVFALTGCSNNDTFTKKTYSTGESEIENITIQLENREIEISPSNDNQIYIDYFDGEKEYLDISILENKELSIKLVYNKNWIDYIGTKAPAEYHKIKIALPNNLISTLSSITTNANIKVNSLSLTQSIALETSGGNILCEQVNIGKSINLKAKNGNITGSIIGGWDDFSISCKIKKGDCNLPLLKENGEKSLIADCNNGDINIQFVN